RELDRMLGQAVALDRPAARPAEREHPRVLAGAVVPQARPVLEAALELVLRRGRLRQQLSDRVELVWEDKVRRGRDREVALFQVVARAREGQGLERLRGGAEVADQAGV